MIRFHGRVALVTGAGGEIGRAICERLVAEGAAVLVVDVRAELAQVTADRIKELGGLAAPIELDQTNEDQVAQLPQLVARAGLGVPTVAVCAAGIQTFEHALELSVTDWDRVQEVNARGTFLVLQQLGRMMRDSSQPGSVTLVASVQGQLGNRYYPHYSASKASVISLTKSFALALAEHRIRVNAVAPGIVDTVMWEAADRELARLTGQASGAPRAERISRIPLQRAGTPADVAGGVAFLASDDASYITGECLHICGGDPML